jgi:hypothetical protein
VVLYALLVVLPVVLAITTAAYLHGVEIEALWLEQDTRMAETGLALLQREMELQAPGLLAAASPVSRWDETNPAVQAALAGDTVLTLEQGEEDLEARVYLWKARGSIGTAGIGVGQPVVWALERDAGYESAIYLRGARAVGSDIDFGPDSLAPRTVRAMATPLPDQSVQVPGALGALVPLRTGAGGTTGSVALLAHPSTPRADHFAAGALPLALIVAAGLILLRMAAVSPGSRRRDEDGGRTEFIVTSIPLLLSMAFVVLVVVHFRSDLEGYTTDFLARELAVAARMGPDLSAEDLARVTGADATILRSGQVESSSLPPGLVLSRLPAEIPGEFRGTIWGRVSVPGDDVLLSAREREDGSALVLSEVHPRAALLQFTGRMGGLGILLLLLLLLYPKASALALEEWEARQEAAG